MDSGRNPYSPGAGTPPPALVGRDKELRDFDVAVQRLQRGRPGRSQMLTGLRGVGKTVLLNKFGKTAQKHGWVHLHLEATEELKFAESIASLIRKTLLRLSGKRRWKDRGSRAFGVLKSFQMRWNLPDDAGSVELVPGHADSGALDEDLSDLFLEVGDIAKRSNTGVLFTIDEIQNLAKPHFAALILALHRISQNQLPLMVAGAGLPSLPALAGEAKSYAERLFAFVRIGSLDAAASADALQQPAAEENVEWRKTALKEVFKMTQGYPYFLQEFGMHTWDVAKRPGVIQVADVKAATPIVRDALDGGFFEARMERRTDAERAYLRAMAKLGAGPYPSGEVAAMLGKTTPQVGQVRDSLIKRGLCYAPEHGVIDFTVPIFDDYLRRRFARG